METRAAVANHACRWIAAGFSEKDVQIMGPSPEAAGGTRLETYPSGERSFDHGWIQIQFAAQNLAVV